MRKRTIVLVVIGLLATASAAFAGFVIFSGVAGSSSDQPIATAQNLGAVSISGNGSATALDAGGTANVPVKATNNNPNAAETISTLPITFTTKDSGGVDDSATCAASFSVSDSGQINGKTIPAGGSITGNIMVALAANTPVSCAGGTYKLNFTGTTSP